MTRPRLTPTLPVSESNTDDRTVITRGPDMSSMVSDNKPYLLIIFPRDQAGRYEITRKGLILGRGSDVDVFLSDSQVSRQHCRVRITAQGIEVEDLQSTNGTQINGDEVDSSLLAATGRLKVGGFVMRVEYCASVEIKDHQDLQQAARTDELTGVPNRRAFFELTAKIVAGHVANNSPLSFVMIDIDHFKRVNDRYGHGAGDYLIREIAQCLRGQLRDSDVFARMGGDEFVMLLPSTDSSEALLFCDRLCETVSQLNISYERTYIPAQVSVGVSTISAAALHTIDDAVALADAAMYRAKKKGRNRVSD